jgi:glucosamine-phosphate N-acetyltransferase
MITEDDLERGVFECLSNLTTVGNIAQDILRAKKILHQMLSNEVYNIIVAAKNDGEIIGMTTLLIEQKLIHDGGKVGHIEDVVTRKGFEGMGVASAVINKALGIAKETGCYKVILDCSEKNVPFYEKLNFKKHEYSMRHNL